MTKASKSTVDTTSAQNLAFATSVVLTLEELSAKRKTWESTDFKKANDGLYDLLAGCLDTFQSKFMKASDSDRKALREELKSQLKAAGVTTQRNTTTLNMLVRFVFGSDRKRAHGYAYVLAAAVSHNKSAAELPAWIIACGGIEEIKRLMVKTEEAKARSARIALAQKKVNKEIEDAKVTPIAQLNLSLTGEYAVLLAKPQPDGTVSILGALPDVKESLFKSMLVRLARRRATSDLDNVQLGKEVQDLLATAATVDTQAAISA